MGVSQGIKMETTTIATTAEPPTTAVAKNIETTPATAKGETTAASQLHSTPSATSAAGGSRDCTSDENAGEVYMLRDDVPAQGLVEKVWLMRKTGNTAGGQVRYALFDDFLTRNFTPTSTPARKHKH